MAQAQSPDTVTPDKATETREAHKVTLVGAAVDLIVGVAKMLIGCLRHGGHPLRAPGP